jgi:hypothetical protein
MRISIVTEGNIVNVNGDRLVVPVATVLNEWAVRFNGTEAEVEYRGDDPNELITATAFYERYQGILDSHVGERTRLDLVAAQAAIVTPQQLIAQLTRERQAQEAQGVSINGIRYAGDPGNRQAISESIQFLEDAGITAFPVWKDSDDVFRVNHPLVDVVNAYRAIGVRRVQLIGAEGQFAEQVRTGGLADVTGLIWPS